MLYCQGMQEPQATYNDLPQEDGVTINVQDSVVFKKIWHTQQPHLLFLAKQILLDQQAAEDAATDAFIKLWNSGLSFPSELAVVKWLRVTTRNHCLNQLRQTKGQEARLHEITSLLHDIEDEWNREDLIAHLLQHVRAEIDLLPERARVIFKMRYLQGMKNEAIGEALGLQHQTVRDYVSKALKQLRLSMKNRPDLLIVLALVCVSGTSEPGIA
jgi:RNA polymerase sigma-70 factor, ECF subfamily